MSFQKQKSMKANRMQVMLFDQNVGNANFNVSEILSS